MDFYIVVFCDFFEICEYGCGKCVVWCDYIKELNMFVIGLVVWFEMDWKYVGFYLFLNVCIDFVGNVGLNGDCWWV